MAKIGVRCPKCGQINVVKNGKSKNGRQRYYCRNKICTTTTFMLEYSYRGCKPGIETQIISMAANASGIRDSSRVFGISTDKVMSTFKNQIGR